MESLYGYRQNEYLNSEKGFTIIEALACLMLVFSLMGIVTLKIVENRNKYSNAIIRSYVCTNYVKISEIFYNENVDFLTDLNKFFKVDGNKIVLEIKKEVIEIEFKYSENYEKSINDTNLVKTYNLDLVFPEKLQKISYVLFKDVNLMRWHYV